MRVWAAAALAALATLALLAGGAHGASKSPIWHPLPANPIELNKPQNFDSMVKAECPADCSVNGCCTMAWDAMSYVASSMPKANCTYCQALRFAMGRLPANEEVTCQACLMNDFKQVITNFKCANDNGRCTKCCMDLALIYTARFQYGCPNPLSEAVATFAYKDSGFVYDGSSTCPRPSPSPSPPLPPGEVRQFEDTDDFIAFLNQSPPSRPDSYDYLDEADIGINDKLDLLRPSEVLAAQRAAGVRPGGM